MKNYTSFAEYQKQYAKDNAEKLKAYRRQHYLKNKEKQLAQSKLNYEQNKDKKLAQHKAWFLAHPGYAAKSAKKWANSEKGKVCRDNYYKLHGDERRKAAREYKAMKRRTDPLYRSIEAARGMIRGSISRMGYTKKAKSTTILGCSFPQFKKHIEEKFVDGMTWLNHGEWHIDHIKPLSTANTEEEVLKLNHYTNLQPLWAVKNLQKGDNVC